MRMSRILLVTCSLMAAGCVANRFGSGAGKKQGPSNTERAGNTATGCTYTIGYWKNHQEHVTQHLPQSLGTDAGANTLEVPTFMVAKHVLDQDYFGDASNGITKLYAQLLAAKLNVANGAAAASMLSTINNADAFLGAHGIGDWDGLSQQDRDMVLGWKDALDAYNNGQAGPAHCAGGTGDGGNPKGDESDSPEPTPIPDESPDVLPDDLDDVIEDESPAQQPNQQPDQSPKSSK